MEDAAEPMKEIRVRVPESVHRAFKLFAVQRGMSLQELIGGILADDPVMSSMNPASRKAPDPLPSSVPEAPSSHAHRKAGVLGGGLWKCSCGATSMNNGRTWH